jgi:hypothetical protein
LSIFSQYDIISIGIETITDAIRRKRIQFESERCKIILKLKVEIKEKISKILIGVLSNPNENVQNTLATLCGVTVLVFNEITHPNPRYFQLEKLLIEKERM